LRGSAYVTLLARWFALIESADMVKLVGYCQCMCCSMQAGLLSMCCWRKLFVFLPSLQWTLWLSVLHGWVELLHAAVISQYHNTSDSHVVSIIYHDQTTTIPYNIRTSVQLQ